MKLVSFDIETGGALQEYALQPFRATRGFGWITSYATASYADGEVVTDGKLQPSVSELSKFLRRCAKEDAHIVAWNAPFDVAWLIAVGLREEVYACKWLDAMLLWRHLEVGPEFIAQPTSWGLKNAVKVFNPSEAGYEQDIDFADVNEELLIYNKADARHTLELATRFIKKIHADEPDTRSPRRLRAALLEAKCIPLVAETYVRGLTVDRAAISTLDSKLEEDSNVAYVKLKLDSPEYISPEVLASPSQLADLLFRKWNIPPVKVTEKGSLSTDKESLHEIALTDHRAALVHQYREANGNRTKFVTSTSASADYNNDGCVRPQARIYGTYTGRMTYYSKQGKGKEERPTGVALHQWKRDPAFRSIITPPPGHTLLEFDFAGQEFRWMAVMSQDPTMLQLCAPGEDAHAYMGARIANMQYQGLVDDVRKGVKGAKDKRQLGKVANLSLQYRTYPNTLMRVARTNYSLPMTLNQAKAIHATYLSTYLQVSNYWTKQIYMSKKYGYVETLAGRRIQLGGEWTEDKKWSRESAAINFPIQGVGADQKYLALAVLRNYLPKVDGHFYFELHDGLFIVVPDAKAERAAHEVKHLLSNLPYKRAWNVDLPIAFPVDAKMGTSWGALKEVS